MLGGAGNISDATYEHYIWLKFEAKDEIKGDTEEGQKEEDLEMISPGPHATPGSRLTLADFRKFVKMDDYMPLYFRKAGQNRRFLFCEKCNHEMTDNMEHCMDCQVCIYNCDHHCVFFSKCIGKGNVYQFYFTIIGLVANFIVVGVFAGMQGVLPEG